ncbi:hypothetical protein BMAPRL20_A0309 [Burkholderia mallei PRL-20]|nr:hypothetical protein BURPS305_4575 [Burkholderia pseudomallei 305]EDK52353.1 hypothetical protein BMAFMH_A0134 [Burkholderia mallei FMH]EDK57683.1 hypothetical protein BMAJHU_D0132 [Burkholderia mallei JHU]EDK87355.1 hypothetical protein BMA721280_C0133 [Burkholderia mallei 2002721280]EDO91002.1 hypothetical protein BURPSPAST_Z0211 [Burkholderia pseudomallei Pasteur 52237]EDP87892.1 hypothetical protein BMA10399_I0282 [Burkholderia mallei ATCC 10399]EDS85863.1 hypothetical protein BURPSS13
MKIHRGHTVNRFETDIPARTRGPRKFICHMNECAQDMNRV